MRNRLRMVGALTALGLFVAHLADQGLLILLLPGALVFWGIWLHSRDW